MVAGVWKGASVVESVAVGATSAGSMKVDGLGAGLG